MKHVLILAALIAAPAFAYEPQVKCAPRNCGMWGADPTPDWVKNCKRLNLCRSES